MQHSAIGVRTTAQAIQQARCRRADGQHAGKSQVRVGLRGAGCIRYNDVASSSVALDASMGALRY